MMRVLGIINARGGSKGIPRKNVKTLSGRPLIEYTVKAGLGAKCIDRLIVSTEDDEIAMLSRELGADVPFMRPLELAGDDVRQIDAVLYAIKYLEDNEQERFDYIALLQPTSPLRISYDIDSAFELLCQENADSVISFTTVDNYHPLHMYYMNGVAPLPVINEERINKQRQNLPEVFIVNGAIRIAKHDVVVNDKTFFSSSTVSYVMPRERSINLDEPFDWELAEFLMAKIK